MATSKLQMLEKDDLIKVLKKTLEQQKHLKEQLAQANQEKVGDKFFIWVFILIKSINLLLPTSFF